MQEQEIIEYNKRCAEFLKGMVYVKSHPNADYSKYKNLEYMYKVDTSQYITPFSQELSAKINHTIIGNIVLGYMINLTELKFHEDWNWIMEVVEAIEKLNFCVRFHETTCRIGNLNYLPTRDTVNLISDFDGETKKEAVVKAINNFLIWYNKT